MRIVTAAVATTPASRAAAPTRAAGSEPWPRTRVIRTRNAIPTGSSSASAVILHAAARPSATPVATAPRQPERACAMRTAPRSVAAVNEARNVSTFQKCDS